MVPGLVAPVVEAALSTVLILPDVLIMIFGIRQKSY